MTAKFFDSVFQTVSGRTEPVSGALVYVYETGTTTLATIYEDDGTTTQTNPITTDSNGNYEFRIAEGDYDIRITYSGFDKTFTGVKVGGGVLASSLISTDAGNNLTTGTDGLLYVSGGKNLPAFRATMSATQIIGLSTYTKVAFDTEDFDTNSDYDPTTNYRFTPSTAGKYQVTITAEIQVSSMTDLRLSLYKNGSQIVQQDKTRPSSGATYRYNMIISDFVEMNGTTDYIEVYAYATGTGNPSVQFERNGNTASWFSAFRLVE